MGRIVKNTTNIISHNNFMFLYKFNNEFPNMLIGGSLALSTCKLLDRYVNDIDIIMPLSYKYKVLKYIKNNIPKRKYNELLYVFSTYKNKYNTARDIVKSIKPDGFGGTHIHVYTDDIQIGIFFKEDEIYKSEGVHGALFTSDRGNGIQISAYITKPDSIIKAKKYYVKVKNAKYDALHGHRPMHKHKHEFDLEYIDQHKKDYIRLLFAVGELL